jgi:hypothetical protein
VSAEILGENDHLSRGGVSEPRIKLVKARLSAARHTELGAKERVSCGWQATRRLRPERATR